ncbi:MAG: hypothetical protein CMJ70_00050 [Planctomycetaceae bacterium]|nr:hypothetical protein [Planctomycetaceae bacterium]HAA71970.1 DUF1501 domain-containing protein [Planctomycetaceae bacterium]|tara:strand:- start:23909 stop:25315 length:1407 start_codon:yes stop_codon:yes gene_type:complete
MLSVQGPEFRQCDGMTRRRFLTAGALGAGGLTLADLFRNEASAGIAASDRAIINIHLDGGPPQMDTIDLKPNAPSEVRGEFQPIATRIPGFQVCELMPRLAAMADRFSYIRSLVGAAGQHDAFQCQSGFRKANMAALGGRPAMGCALTRLRGSSDDPAPTFVDLLQGRPLVRNSARPGFLGPSFKPFRPDISKIFPRPLEVGMVKELAALGNNHTTSLALNDTLDAKRLGDRASLLTELDRVKCELDASGNMEALDRFHQQAASILTSGRFADALDLSKIAPHELKRYTAPASSVERFVTADDHRSMRKFLLARRLVEAGVRCVSVSFSDFDTHSGNFTRMKHMLPILDQGLTALVSDLEERGMLDHVTIVAWGEFGRTPKINKNAGRDHWPQVAPAILTGGGMNLGQVIGATDRTAATATSRPIHYKDVFATLYHTIGIDPHHATVIDPTGRPQYLLDHGQPISELV